MNGFSTIAGIVAGFKAGEISEREATRLLRALGCDDDLGKLLAMGAGIAGGILGGSIVADAVDTILGDWF